MLLNQKILEKRAELDALTAIKDYTENFTIQLEALESKLDSMVEGAETVNKVLSTWQNVVQSISLASLGLYKYSQGDYAQGKPLPELLLRMRLKKEEEYEDDEIEENSQGQDYAEATDEAYEKESNN